MALIDIIKFVLSDASEVTFSQSEVITYAQSVTQKEQVFNAGSYGHAIFRYGEEQIFYPVTFNVNYPGTLDKVNQLYNETEAMIFYYELLINVESKDTVKIVRNGMKWGYDMAYEQAAYPITLKFYKSISSSGNFYVIDMTNDIIKV